jgi:hypothetical protein
MQGPTKDNEDSSSTTDNAREGPNWNRTIAVRRQAAKRALPRDLAAGELLVSQQDEENPAGKKPRLEDTLLTTTTTDQAAQKTAPPDVSVGRSDVNNVDPVTDTQPNAVATRATGRWTLDEDAKLTSVVQ